MVLTELAEEVHRIGASHVPSVLDAKQLRRLMSSIRPEAAEGVVRASSRVAYGARGLLAARPHLRRRLSELMLDRIANAVLGDGAIAVDAVFLDKRPDANWAVPAHQDVVVPVPSAADQQDVRNLRHRHGLAYGEPADHILQELVALRVHFDDAGVDNGALSIATGSHSLGRLTGAEIQQLVPESFRLYECRAGDVLLMKPLAVHRSGRALVPTHRRVLQILYGPRDGWHARGTRDAA